MQQCLLRRSASLNPHTPANIHNLLSAVLKYILSDNLQLPVAPTVLLSLLKLEVFLSQRTFLHNDYATDFFVPVQESLSLSLFQLWLTTFRSQPSGITPPFSRELLPFRTSPMPDLLCQVLLFPFPALIP